MNYSDKENYQKKFLKMKDFVNFKKVYNGSRIGQEVRSNYNKANKEKGKKYNIDMFYKFMLSLVEIERVDKNGNLLIRKSKTTDYENLYIRVIGTRKIKVIKQKKAKSTKPKKWWNTKNGFIPYFNCQTTLYYVKLLKDGLTAYKIGITTKKDVLDRFKEENVTVEVIKQWTFEEGKEAFTKEQEVLREFKSFKHPNGIFFLQNGGATELFYADVLGLDFKAMGL